MKKLLSVCDVCGRPPNGDSPDFLYTMTCEHEICNECLYPCPQMALLQPAGTKYPRPPGKCPVCGEGITNFEAANREYREREQPRRTDDDQGKAARLHLGLPR